MNILLGLLVKHSFFLSFFRNSVFVSCAFADVAKVKINNRVEKLIFIIFLKEKIFIVLHFPDRLARKLHSLPEIVRSILFAGEIIILKIGLG